MCSDSDGVDGVEPIVPRTRRARWIDAVQPEIWAIDGPFGGLDGPGGSWRGRSSAHTTRMWLSGGCH
jgi:hypothetical protein